jgi:aldehyde dehydrogenase (NAD+)
MEKAQLNAVSEWLKTPKTSYIDGRFVSPEGGSLVTSENPATGAPVGRYFESSKAEVDAAAAAARGAFRDGAWARWTRRERQVALQKIGELIRRNRAELATLETLDNGKLYSEAYVDDLPETADVFDYYAGWIDKYYSEVSPVEKGFLNYTVREPVGVCALIVPWNFPLLMAAWKLAPALAMGNTVIVKPSPFTSLSLLRLVELIDAEGLLPEGVLNVVLGGGEVGGALTRHPLVDKVAFTGSTATGKDVVRGAAESNLKAVTLELGGKSPNIIFADAPDLGFAIDRSFTAMFSHKAEKCSEPTRLIVERSVYGQVLEALAQQADAVVCGDPFDERSTQGAQCFKAHCDRIMEYIASGKDAGARLVAGGSRDTRGANAKGYFVRPTIFADVRNDMRIAQEEIFGSVLCVIPFTTEDEAVAIANDTTYGLAAGFWTRDVARVHRVAGRLEAGQVFVNKYGCYDFASPFGGFKQSGWGKEMAVHSLEAYTKLKSIWVAYQ